MLRDWINCKNFKLNTYYTGKKTDLFLRILLSQPLTLHVFHRTSLPQHDFESLEENPYRNSSAMHTLRWDDLQTCNF
jgi:hypothetical protein